jgi:hypothetical protein
LEVPLRLAGRRCGSGAIVLSSRLTDVKISEKIVERIVLIAAKRFPEVGP